MKRVMGLVGALIALPVLATTMVALDVPGLTKASDVVVRAHVKQSQARWTQDRRRIITDTELQIVEVLKGNASGTIVVMQPGGEIGDLGQVVHGTATFAPGEEVVVFLEGRGDRFTVTGMTQGKFHVDRSAAAPTAAADPDGDSLLVDPKTHQPVAATAKVYPLDELTRLVRSSVGTLPVEPTGKPTVKVVP